MEIPSRRSRRSILAPRRSAATNPPSRDARKVRPMEVRFNPVPFAARIAIVFTAAECSYEQTARNCYRWQPPRRCHLLHKFPAGFPVYARIRARVTAPRTRSVRSDDSRDASSRSPFSVKSSIASSRSFGSRFPKRGDNVSSETLVLVDRSFATFSGLSRHKRREQRASLAGSLSSLALPADRLSRARVDRRKRTPPPSLLSRYSKARNVHALTTAYLFPRSAYLFPAAHSALARILPADPLRDRTSRTYLLLFVHARVGQG